MKSACCSNEYTGEQLDVLSTGDLDEVEKNTYVRLVMSVKGKYRTVHRYTISVYLMMIAHGQ